MNAHDILLDGLRSTDATLVDRALAFEIPTCIADTLDVDDAELAVRRMRRMIDVIVASPKTWTIFGNGVVAVHDRGSSTSFDGCRAEIKRARSPGPNAASGEDPGETLSVLVDTPDRASRLSVRLPSMALPITTGIAAADVSPDAARIQALAAVLSVHRGAAARMDETLVARTSVTSPHPSALLDDAWTTISSLAVLLRRSTFAALNMRINVNVADGERPTDLNVTVSPSGAKLILDDVTRRAVVGRMPAMTRLMIAGVDQHGRDPVSNVRRAPASTYDVKRLRLTSTVRDASEDPMSTMRALAHLGLHDMPTITREDER